MKLSKNWAINLCGMGPQESGVLTNTPLGGSGFCAATGEALNCHHCVMPRWAFECVCVCACLGEKGSRGDAEGTQV